MRTAKITVAPWAGGLILIPTTNFLTIPTAFPVKDQQNGKFHDSVNAGRDSVGGQMTGW